MNDQRPLRLGDTVDDYCPRERRLTNHVITVMAGDDVTHTRCTACDADHPFKHARVPAKKRSSDAGALYDAVLAGVLKPKRAAEPAGVAPPAELQPVPVAEVAPVAVAADPVAPMAEVATGVIDAPVADTVADIEMPAAVAATEAEPAAGSWGHRPLIRATLPRAEGQAPSMPRPIPEFTMHRHPGGQGRRHQGGGFGRHRDQGRGNGRSRFSR